MGSGRLGVGTEDGLTVGALGLGTVGGVGMTTGKLGVGKAGTDGEGRGSTNTSPGTAGNAAADAGTARAMPASATPRMEKAAR